MQPARIRLPRGQFALRRCEPYPASASGHGTYATTADGRLTLASGRRAWVSDRRNSGSSPAGHWRFPRIYGALSDTHANPLSNVSSAVHYIRWWAGKACERF